MNQAIQSGYVLQIQCHHLVILFLFSKVFLCSFPAGWHCAYTYFNMVHRFLNVDSVAKSNHIFYIDHLMSLNHYLCGGVIYRAARIETVFNVRRILCACTQIRSMLHDEITTLVNSRIVFFLIFQFDLTNIISTETSLLTSV